MYNRKGTIEVQKWTNYITVAKNRLKYGTADTQEISEDSYER